MRVQALAAGDVALIARIDRSEHVDVQYAVVDGQLVEQPVTIAEVPAWDPAGTGPHTVAAMVDFCASAIAEGAALLGAYEDDELAGLAVVDPSLEPGLAQLVFLHVSRPHRRRGAARALWDAAAELAVAGGASAMYVSATPTGSAIGFYLQQGCRLADPVHPALFEKEPEDIHLIAEL